MYDLAIADYAIERKHLMSILSERLRELRLRRGFKTQKAFSEKSGLSQQNISQYERGILPGVTALTQIADALETTIDYLAGRTDDDRPLSPDERRLVEAHRRGDKGAVDAMFSAKFDDLFKNDPTAQSGG